jgi:hypothetical protein
LEKDMTKDATIIETTWTDQNTGQPIPVRIDVATRKFEIDGEWYDVRELVDALRALGWEVRDLNN